MLQSISWGQLAVGLVIIFTIYYGYLAIRYTADLKGFTPKRKPAVLREDEKFADEPEEETEEAGPVTAGSENPENSDAVFDRIEELVARLKDRIGRAGKENLMKGELAAELQAIVSGYPDLQHSTYRSALNELIAYECTANGLTALSENELEELWVM
jgi:hypothetical protein